MSEGTEREMEMLREKLDAADIEAESLRAQIAEASARCKQNEQFADEVFGKTSDVRKRMEAMKRMINLGLMEQIVEEFVDENKIEYSEPVKMGGMKFGALYWVSNEPEWEKQVEEFEAEYNALVYHAVHSYTTFGECLSLLYVSDYPDEWEYDNEDIKDGYVMTYTINLDYPDCSEFGSIVVREAGGGLVRIG